MLEEITLDHSWLMSQEPQNRADEALLVRFYLRPRQDKEESDKAGRPIFKDVEYVIIAKPGDRLDVHDQPATRTDKLRFRKHYEAFKQGQGDRVVGTPLAKWPLIQASQVEELKYFNVVTVEQLAMMPDGNIPNVGNISHLKRMAVDYLETARGQAPVTQMRAELEKRDTMLEAMRRQMEEQAKMIADLSSRADETKKAAKAVTPKSKE